MFSVIIPVYNCEKTIRQVLDSVRRQTRFDLVEEIIVINDGSLDRTGEVVADYISSHPAMKIQYLRHKNHGVSYTRNRGIRAAKAEWIALLDGDTLAIPGTQLLCAPRKHFPKDFTSVMLVSS